MAARIPVVLHEPPAWHPDEEAPRPRPAEAQKKGPRDAWDFLKPGSQDEETPAPKEMKKVEEGD